jgi:predicted RNA-binding protein associated with RNAse of E/G family
VLLLLLPGVALYKRWSAQEPMFTAVEGWNVDADGQKLAAVEAEDEDYSLVTLYKALRARRQ